MARASSAARASVDVVVRAELDGGGEAGRAGWAESGNRRASAHHGPLQASSNGLPPEIWRGGPRGRRARPRGRRRRARAGCRGRGAAPPRCRHGGRGRCRRHGRGRAARGGGRRSPRAGSALRQRGRARRSDHGDVDRRHPSPSQPHRAPSATSVAEVGIAAVEVARGVGLVAAAQVALGLLARADRVGDWHEHGLAEKVEPAAEQNRPARAAPACLAARRRWRPACRYAFGRRARRSRRSTVTSRRVPDRHLRQRQDLPPQSREAP